MTSRVLTLQGKYDRDQCFKSTVPCGYRGSQLVGSKGTCYFLSENISIAAERTVSISILSIANQNKNKSIEFACKIKAIENSVYKT